MCKRSPLIFQHPAWPFCIRSLLPSPPWLLKSFYLHVSCLSEYLTSTVDITRKRKQIYVERLRDLSVMNEITRMRLFFQYKYLMNHFLCFLFVFVFLEKYIISLTFLFMLKYYSQNCFAFCSYIYSSFHTYILLISHNPVGDFSFIIYDF